MSDLMLLRIFITLVFSFTIAFTFRRRREDETEMNVHCFEPVVGPLLLPVIMLTLVIIGLWFAGPSGVFLAASDIAGVAIEICVYHILLYALLPLIRRYFEARTAALMWLIPNFLYIGLYAFMRNDKPLWVIDMGDISFGPIAAVWAAGFIAVMALSLISHLSFRRELLKDAFDCEEERMLALWDDTQTRLRFKKHGYRLMISPYLATPISVGLYRWSIRVLIPDLRYSDEDLRLIFTHELLHIKHLDSRIKFFQTFCRALCWFDPFVWSGMKRCSDDLELSCDERLIWVCGEGARKRYADLILRTAGSDRGFTTCLSSSAKGLKYRLNRIMEPKKRAEGTVILAVLVAFMLFFSGSAALSFSAGTLGEELDIDRNNITVNNVNFYPGKAYNGVSSWDEDGLLDALMGLELRSLVGKNYSYLDDVNELRVYLGTGSGDTSIRIYVTDHTASITDWSEYGEDRSRGLTRRFYLKEEPDWELFRSFLTEDEPYPRQPQMYMYQGSWTGQGNLVLPHVLSMTQKGEPWEPWEPEWMKFNEEERVTETVIVGLPPSDVRFRFDSEPLEGITLTREPVFDGEFDPETWVPDEYVMPKWPGSCIFRIKGSFASTRETVYDCEFIVVRVAPGDEERYEKLEAERNGRKDAKQ